MRRKAANFLADLVFVELLSLRCVFSSVGSLRVGVPGAPSLSVAGRLAVRCARLLLFRSFSSFVVAVRRLLSASRRLALALVVLWLPVEPRQL